MKRGGVGRFALRVLCSVVRAQCMQETRGGGELCSVERRSHPHLCYCNLSRGRSLTPDRYILPPRRHIDRAMSTRELRIPYPEELPEAMDQSPDEFERELRFLVAAKLYEVGRITSGRAADVAGMERADFLNELGTHRISVWNYDEEELEREIEAARDRADSHL